MKKKTPSISLCALSLAISPVNNRAPTEIQLTPAGRFSATDGRPFEVPGKSWYIDTNIANHVIALTSAITNKLVIDYEHQTLLKEKNGQPAPAAGWFKDLEWRESGLWAVNVEWTPKAEQQILDREYLYISPVFQYSPETGEIQRMRMAAITNSPGVDGMANLASLTSEELTNLFDQTDSEEEQPMWKALLKKLGLKEDATEEQAIAALTQLQTQAEDNGAKLEEAEGKVAALTAQVDAPDPQKWVPVNVMQELQTQVAALTATQAQDNVQHTVDKAIENGKLLPAQRDWAVSLGTSNVAALTQYLDTAKPIVALNHKQADQNNTPENGNTAALTETQLQAANAFGVSPEEFKQTLDKYGE